MNYVSFAVAIHPTITFEYIGLRACCVFQRNLKTNTVPGTDPEAKIERRGHTKEYFIIKMPKEF